LRKIL